MSLRVFLHLHIAMKDLAAMSLPRNLAGLKSSVNLPVEPSFVMYEPLSRKFGRAFAEKAVLIELILYSLRQINS